MNVLGITHYEFFPPYFYGHDASACLQSDGVTRSAVSEERFTRNKHHAGFPWHSVNYVLSNDDLSYENIDLVAVPWPEKFNKALPLKERFIRFGRRFFYGSFASDRKKVTPIEKLKVVGIDHQLSHAASAYRNSGFKDALVLSLDGRGAEMDASSSCGALYHGENGEIKRKQVYECASLGDFYGFATAILGFQVFDGEGKTMGLASFGKVDEKALRFLEKYVPKVEGTMLGDSEKKLKGVGEVLFNVHRHYYTDLAIGMEVAKQVGRENFAASAQHLLEQSVVKLVSNAIKESGFDKLCLAGGVFLNVKLNKKLRELDGVKDIFIYPNPGDAGATVGAAMEAEYRVTGKQPKPVRSVYLGPDYSDVEIEAALRKHKNFSYKKISDPAGETAELVSKGNIVGWFQGRMEWGPRALGARSVISAPHDVKVKDKLNLHLKQREWFMPFAPAMLYEKAGSYLKDPCESPYMIMAFDIVPEAKKSIAATVHVDDTVRAQTVKREQNPVYYDMIKEYGKLTGTPVVLNTSFNRHGLPIVCSPQDALWHLKVNCVEKLVIGNYLVSRSN